jgi:hypothetical protein
MDDTRECLRRLGLPPGDRHDLPTSSKRFPDGAQYRVEIPSVEGPVVLAETLAAAGAARVVVHRVSQGSGGLLLTDSELDAMAALGADRGVEVSIFARPTASWGTGAAARTEGGAAGGAQVRGADGLVHCLEDVRRTSAAGIRSVLMTDLGVLRTAARMRAAGDLPSDLQFKVSVLAGLANPASIQLAAELGADTYNVPTDLSLAQIAAIRQAVDIPLDLYVEAPDDLGGFVRHYEIAEIVRVAAPVYLKFGLRNAPNIYPSGLHLEATAVLLARERVRRARIGLDLLHRYDPGASTSPVPAPGLAVPRPGGSRQAPAPGSP